MKVTRALTAVWRWVCMQALKVLLRMKYRQRSPGEIISITEIDRFNRLMLDARDCHAMNQVHHSPTTERA